MKRRPFSLLIFLSAVVVGCSSLSSVEYCHVSVRLQNDANVDIGWVSIGQDVHKSDFGVLGGKGARKTALVPVSFMKDFPINWEEENDQVGKGKLTKIDLRHLAGCNYITLTYQGNGVWIAKCDEPMQTTNTVSSLPSNQ